MKFGVLLNKIAILSLKEMPSSCSVCIFEKGYCDLFDDFKCIALRGTLLKVHNDFMTQCHPNCPLISIDTQELEEAMNHLRILYNYELATKEEKEYFDEKEISATDLANYFITIKDLITKLGVK